MNGPDSHAVLCSCELTEYERDKKTTALALALAIERNLHAFPTLNSVARLIDQLVLLNKNLVSDLWKIFLGATLAGLRV